MNPMSVWLQRTLRLAPQPRGFHLVTRQVVAALPEIARIQIGVLHVFVQHTSASLSLNENADPDVRVDLEMAISRIVRDDLPYVHTLEGADDMPAHVKNSLLGAAVSIPITQGKLNLGTWQGIYLCEHRDRATERHLVLTAWGQGTE